MAFQESRQPHYMNEQPPHERYIEKCVQGKTISFIDNDILKILVVWLYRVKIAGTAKTSIRQACQTNIHETYILIEFRIGLPEKHGNKYGTLISVSIFHLSISTGYHHRRHREHECGGNFSPAPISNQTEPTRHIDLETQLRKNQTA